jgi:hypothetical protein
MGGFQSPRSPEALWREARAHGAQGAVEEEVRAYDELIVLYGKSDDVRVREYVAAALLHKGATLRLAARRTEAVAAWGALLKHFHAGESAKIDEYRDDALKRYNKLMRPGANAGGTNL